MVSRIRPPLLKQMIQRRVLEAIRSYGPLSRADVTRESGISAPTVSKAVAALLEARLLEEGEMQEGALGRPGKILRLATETAQVLGVVVDTKRCSVASTGLDGQLRPERTEQFVTPGTYEGLIDALATAAERILARHPATALGVGISLPGLVDPQAQRAVYCPNLHLIDDHSPGRDLGQRLQIENVLIQESHSLCLAEQHYGAAKGMQDFALLDITEGLGLGVMSGGHLITGHRGLGGELGHITVDPSGRLCGCGNHGCLETVATEAALVSAVSDKLGRLIDFDDMIPLVREGKLQPTAEINRTLEYLAIGIAAVINLFNPAAVLIYGRLFDVQEGLFEHLIEIVRRRSLPPSMADCQILRAQGSKRQGAVASIIEHLLSSSGPQLAPMNRNKLDLTNRRR